MRDIHTLTLTVKVYCEHCGKKQIAIEEENGGLNYVACKRCGKEGSLRERRCLK